MSITMRIIQRFNAPHEREFMALEREFAALEALLERQRPFFEEVRIEFYQNLEFA